jgi:hypothetical protein
VDSALSLQSTEREIIVIDDASLRYKGYGIEILPSLTSRPLRVLRK